MNNQSSDVFIVGRYAYIPTHGFDPDGARIIIEPIYKVEIDVDEIRKYVAMQLSSPMQRLNLRTVDDYKPYRNLLPNATGTKSWKKLCSSGLAYSIERTEKKYIISKASLDNKGRWIYEKENEKTYPLETNLQIIISDIINDSTKI